VAENKLYMAPQGKKKSSENTDGDWGWQPDPAAMFVIITHYNLQCSGLAWSTRELKSIEIQKTSRIALYRHKRRCPENTVIHKLSYR